MGHGGCIRIMMLGRYTDLVTRSPIMFSWPFYKSETPKQHRCHNTSLNQPAAWLGLSALLDEQSGILGYRTIWISDSHLGTQGSRADALLHFLKHTRSETLYLVGDIVDGWQLEKRFFWPQEHDDVIQKLLRKARHGTRVIYIPGNHDLDPESGDKTKPCYAYMHFL